MTTSSSSASKAVAEEIAVLMADSPHAGPLEHRRLLTLCLDLPSSIVISGYPSALYEELLGDWRRVEINVARSSGHGRGEGESPRATEVLWCNFDPPTQGAFF